MTLARPYLDQLFEVIDDGYCLCEMLRGPDGAPLDYRFLETNPLFETMTGLVGAEGRTAREMVPGLEQEWFERYDQVARGTSIRFQSRSEVMGRDFDVFATPVKPDGCFALVFRDVTERLRIEREREEARQKAENLLAELNHRVMNTLAMITSIVRMEARRLDEPAGQRALAGIVTRLAAVTALYRALNRAADVSEVAAERYLPEVVNSVAHSVADATQIEVRCDIAAESLPTARAAPLGLLLNEVMTNALKYAFPAGRRGTIRVVLRRLDAERVELSVADDGIGTAATHDPAREPGIGTGLIEAFVQQIDGRLGVESSDRGTRVAIVFPLREREREPAGDDA